MKQLHPTAALSIMAGIITITAVWQHPCITLISLIFSVCVCVIIKGAAALKTVLYALPLCAVGVVINALFNNRGNTGLFRLANGNMVTAEAIIYSVFAGGMIIALVMWFTVFSSIFTSDKIVYLCSGILPIFGLLVAMTLKAVPEFMRCIKSAASAQRFVGNDIYTGKLKDRIKAAGAVLSSAVGMSVDKAVQTALSMKSRGYGSKNRRSSYSRYCFGIKDGAYIVLSLAAAGVIAFCAVKGKGAYYYPEFYIGTDREFFIGVIAFSLLCALPAMIECYQRLKYQAINNNVQRR